MAKGDTDILHFFFLVADIGDRDGVGSANTHVRNIVPAVFHGSGAIDGAGGYMDGFNSGAYKHFIRSCIFNGARDAAGGDLCE